MYIYTKAERQKIVLISSLNMAEKFRVGAKIILLKEEVMKQMS